MRQKRIFAWAVGIVLVAFTLLLQQEALPQQSAEQLYEAALLKKNADGDLEGAIEIFRQILARFPEERNVAAKAQLQVGICYEKLGQKRTKLAQEAFQKVLDNYPGQTEVVKIAKEKLSVLQRGQTVLVPDVGELRIRQISSGLNEVIDSLERQLFSYRDETGNLAVMEVETGFKRILTNSASWETGDFVSRSILSPDARLVAYYWYSGYSSGDLRIMNIDGSGQRILYPGEDVSPELREDFWPVVWAPDCMRVLGILMKKDGERRLAYISVSDGTIKLIKDLNRINPDNIDISPDGRWIVYDLPKKNGTGKYDIFLLTSDGSLEIPLVKHPADNRLLGWTPDGGWVLFASDRAGSWDAWVLPVKEGKPQGDPRLVKRDFGILGAWTGVRPVGFAPNGSFYYMVNSWLEEVQVATLDNEKIKVLTPPQKVAHGYQGANCYPDWSPDGKYLAFSSRREPRGLGTGALCFISTDTGEQKEFFFPELKGNFIRVNWCPDGKSLLVVGADKNDRAGIFRVYPETGEIRPIVTEGSGFHSPRCSPDGKKVFYEIDSWEDNIFRVMCYNFETGHQKEIYRSSSQIIRLDISPDGKWLAFLEMADGTLKVIPSEGGQSKVLHKFKDDWSTSVAWSPDGKYLFFSRIPEGSGKTGRIELWRIPKEGGDPVKYPLEAKGIENLRIHPDGQKITFNTFKANRELWVMENFLPKPKSKR